MSFLSYGRVALSHKCVKSGTEAQELKIFPLSNSGFQNGKPPKSLPLRVFKLQMFTEL